MRYIDADAFLVNLTGYAAPEMVWDRGDIEHKLDEMTTVDVVEVKRGEWIYNPNGMDWGLGAWVCSLCKCKNDNLGMSKEINPYLFAGGKYCPHCSAKMGCGSSDI